MKWYFFYTPNYHFYKNHIEDRLKNSKFYADPILINNLKLSPIHHHFLNNTTKIELVIDCIKKNMGNYIIFSDATIYINDKVEEFYDYIITKTKLGVDMYFTQEHNRTNIGFMLINCNETSLSFWEKILNTMKFHINNGVDIHDQAAVNDLIDVYENINISIFEREYIWCSDYIYSPIKESFYLFKITIDFNSNVTRHNQRLNALYYLNFISQDEYNKNIE